MLTQGNYPKEKEQSRQFKPKIYQGRKIGQGRNNYYDRGKQQDMFRLSNNDRGRRLKQEHKIIAEQPLEGNIEEIMGIVNLIGVEACQEMDNFQVILGGMIEVVLGQDKVLEQRPI